MDPGAQSSHCFPTSLDCLHILLYRCSRFPCTWMKPPEITPNNLKNKKCLNYFSNSSTQQQLQVGSEYVVSVNCEWLLACGNLAVVNYNMWQSTIHSFLSSASEVLWLKSHGFPFCLRVSSQAYSPELQTKGIKPLKWPG